MNHESMSSTEYPFKIYFSLEISMRMYEQTGYTKDQSRSAQN